MKSANHHSAFSAGRFHLGTKEVEKMRWLRREYALNYKDLGRRFGISPQQAKRYLEDGYART